MDDLSEKLNELLSDEESMKQIKELAELLSGAASDPDNTNGNTEGSEAADKQSGIDISQLLGAFTGNADNNGSGIDLNMIMSLMGLIQNGTEDKNRDFLLALRPLLSTDKQAKLDKAVKLLRIYGIYNTLKQSGMLNDLGRLL